MAEAVTVVVGDVVAVSVNGHFSCSCFFYVCVSVFMFVVAAVVIVVHGDVSGVYVVHAVVVIVFFFKWDVHVSLRIKQ